MTSIELNNPSAWHPLRVASQTRAPNVIAAIARATPAPKRETRDSLEKRGAVITMKKMRISTKFSAEMRECPAPLWQAEGASSLAHWVTDIMEQQTRDSYAPAEGRSERVVDAWGALEQRLTVPPGGSRVIPLAARERVVVFCDEPATLQISNTNPSHTLRLRTLDSASGETTNVACVAPAGVGVVSANGKSAAVVELMPQ